MSQGSSASLYHEVYKGIGRGTETSSALPPQAVTSNRKKKKFQEATMDRLEEIGLSQVRKNLVYNEYYLMLEGDLAYTDYDEQPEILKHVSDIREKADIPSYVRHFDLIGQIERHLQGKYNDTKHKFTVDFFDTISKNEYDRELSNRIFKYTQDVFQTELELRLLKNGVSLKQEFNSEEEKQQYKQYLEQQKKQFDTPPEIKSAMNTQWKPIAAKWAQGTIEKDRLKFSLDELEREFFTDFFLTGRYFKHYHIGYDYFTVERWNPIETFFSEDYNIKYPQDAEYVGNIQEMSPSAIVNKFGHLMKQKDIEKILNAYSFYGKPSSSEPTNGLQEVLENNFNGETDNVPHAEYYDRQSNLELQSALGQPLGEETYYNSQGDEVTKDAWIPDYGNHSTGTDNVSKFLRRDINVREDTIRVTQAYWRSWDKVGLIYRQKENGMTTLDWVTDELDQDFLKDFDISKLKDKSLQQFINEYEAGELEPNSMVWTYAPKTWRGVKLAGTNTILNKDLYLGVEPMDFQIKGGESNIYDVKLPVTGIITDSEAKKLRPYQIEYNYQMNLMHSLTEKEIGIFWLFDMSLLPSEFQEMGDAQEILLNVSDMARDIGLVPLDMSKQNMRNRGSQQFNSMMAQDISFVPQIKQKMELANYYKSLALEQIGITEQDTKTPSEYSTAEGIKIGQQNSFAQVEGLFEKMDNSRLKDMEIDLAINQQIQGEDGVIKLGYTNSDEEQALVREVFKDENFKLRNFGLFPTSDSKNKRQLKEFKQYLLSNNAIQNDLVDIAEVITTDSFSVVNKILRKSQQERLEQEEKQRQFQKDLQQKKNEGEMQKVQAERQFKMSEQDKELQNNLQVANINNLGKVKDRDEEPGDEKAINETTRKYLSDEQRSENEQKKLDLKEKDQDQKAKEALENLKLKQEELRLKKEQNEIRKKETKAKTFGDMLNKN